jgi:hydroxymethylglutaryl-CoA synthase
MTIPITTPSVDSEVPRPKDVGVLAMEVYFPRRVRHASISFAVGC